MWKNTFSVAMKQTLAHILFFIGDRISYPMAKYDLGFLYPIYNWCMIKSGEFDVKGKLWTKP